MRIKKFTTCCIVCTAALIVIAGCATMKSTDKIAYEKFCGTWVNNEYEGKAYPDVKLIFNPDGTGAYYVNLLVTGSGGPLTYTVQKKWTDSEGNYWYHLIIKLPHQQSATMYELLKIDRYTRIMERNYSSSDFPTAIDPKDLHSDYAMYYRF